MTGRKNRFSSLCCGSAKPDSTASTSSPQKLPDYAKRIREAAEAVDEERVDADLDALFDYISRLSDFIKKAFASGDEQTIARGFLKGMGTAHVVNIGFLVVANAWERYEEMSANQNECLSLLKEMSKLEQHVKELQKRPESKRGMEASIGQAIELIIEASIACCTQIEASTIRRFLSAKSSRKKLAELEKKLQQTYTDIQKYPEDTVGIDEPLQEVIKKLEWESDKNAVAEGWEKIEAQQCNQSWSCGVYTKQGLSNEENLLKKFQSEFVSMLTNGEGKPLNISGCPLNTLLLVMFDGRQDFRPDSFPLHLLEESIDDIQTHFEMVYFGNHWDQLPKKVADRIVGHAPANRDTKAFFQRLFSSVVQFSTDYQQKVAISFRTSSFQMTAEIVSGENGDKYLSRWKYFADESEKMEVEDFVVTKCGRYLKLKQVAERGGGSPIALLRELFAGGEEEISVSLDGESTKVGVDELQGKTIFLNIRPGNNSFDISLHALVEMYNVEKERFNFEIITVPIIQEDTTMEVYEKFSREVPWLVLQNPWQLTNAIKYFLVEGYPLWTEGWDDWYPNRMRIIESDGTIAPYRNRGVLRMVNTWGAAAYPFTAEKEEQLIREAAAMSHAMFLFQHLERVAEQLREATGQQKMIWLCCCHEKKFTNSMKDVLTELSDIIYIIYIPIFHRGGVKFGYFTAAIYEGWYSLEPSKMSSAEMGGIFSLSLSEYEAMRFWVRIRSLKKGIIAEDQLREMLRIPDDELHHEFHNTTSWMFIMDEDGNLITTKGEEIVKLLSEKYSDDRVKELMQQLLKGTQTSWKKTLLELEETMLKTSLKKTRLELEKMLNIVDGEDNEGYADDDDVDSEGE